MIQSREIQNSERVEQFLLQYRERMVAAKSLFDFRAALTDVILNVVGVSGILFYPLYRGAKPDADVVLHSSFVDRDRAVAAAIAAFPRLDRDFHVISSFLKESVRVRDVLKYYGREFLQKTWVHKELFVPFSADQVLSAFLGTDKPSALGYLCLIRSKEEPRFTDGDLEMLEIIRRTAEESLRRMVEVDGETSTSSQILGILAAGMPHPSALLDTDGVLLWANRAAEQKLGEKVLQVSGRYVMFSSSEVVDRWRNAVREAHSVAESPYRVDLHIIVNRIERSENLPIYMVMDTEAFMESGPEWQALSAREREIAELAAQGYAPLNIGAVLSISTGTVRNHLKSIYRKLNVSSRVELALKMNL